MNTSIALAQIFAIYFSVIGLSLIINKRFFKAMLKDLVYSHIAMLIIATMTLILGSVLVTVHNLWTSDWRLLVTLTCYLVLISGIVRTLFPTWIRRVAAAWLQHDHAYILAGLSCIGFGALFGYFAYTAL